MGEGRSEPEEIRGTVFLANISSFFPKRIAWRVVLSKIADPGALCLPWLRAAPGLLAYSTCALNPVECEAGMGRWELRRPGVETGFVSVGLFLVALMPTKGGFLK